jgi:hypothetical protein
MRLYLINKIQKQVGNPISRFSIRRKAERNTSRNKARTNEIETNRKWKMIHQIY